MKIGDRLEAHRRNKTPQKRVRYPDEMRREAGAYYAREVERGRTRLEVARELGVHANTLDCWRGGKQDGRASAGFRPVMVEASQRSGRTVVVHGPGGLRIEGLGVSELAELMRALR